MLMDTIYNTLLAYFCTYIGGYYKPDPIKAELAMRPSATFNAIIDK